jgi:hypothetical protein
LPTQAQMQVLLNERYQTIIDLLDPDLPCYEQDSSTRTELLKEGLALIDSARRNLASYAADFRCPPQRLIVF